jgi:hypothetical protein
VPGADGLQKGVELRAVVEVLQVTEFMKHNVVLQFLRKGYKP